MLLAQLGWMVSLTLPDTVPECPRAPLEPSAWVSRDLCVQNCGRAASSPRPLTVGLPHLLGAGGRRRTAGSEAKDSLLGMAGTAARESLFYAVP